jgi:adenosylhomocysteine nucleosidase
MAMPNKKIAIVAAMEREVRSFVRSWTVRTIEHCGRQYRLFENGDVGLIFGGIGAEAARRATEAVIQKIKPVRVVSVGFAGALNGSLQVGDILEPRTVINAADGVRIEVGSGNGVLVSSTAVAGKEQKVRLGNAYGAIAVDMEAAAVAQGAQAQGIEFGALKAISDAADFSLAPMDRFVATDGSFHSLRFAVHVALRPRLWGTTFALARNSSRASHALCGALVSYLDREIHSPQAFPNESFVDESNPTKVSPEFAGADTRTGTPAHAQATEKHQEKQ